MSRILVIIFALAFFISSACQRTSTSTPTATPEAQANLVAKGRAVYQTNCTACHNTDPHKPGSLGPEVFGSSKELLEARILRADYPPDYKAKRMTHVMNALPHLKGDLEAIHAFLNAP